MAAAAARDSAARADSARAEETSKSLKVTNVMIGKRIGEGSRVTEPTFQFEPVDFQFAPETVQIRLVRRSARSRPRRRERAGPGDGRIVGPVRIDWS